MQDQGSCRGPILGLHPNTAFSCLATGKHSGRFFREGRPSLTHQRRAKARSWWTTPVPGAPSTPSAHLAQIFAKRP